MKLEWRAALTKTGDRAPGFRGGFMSVAYSQPATPGPHFTWRSYLLFLTVTGLIFGVLAGIGIYQDIQAGKQTAEVTNPFFLFGAVLALVAAGFLLGSIAYVIVFAIRKTIFALTVAHEKTESISRESEQLQGALEQDFVTNLVRINFKYIDAYYLQTKIQADKSFNFSLAAAVVSLLLIIFGIVLSLFGQTNSATVSAGAGVLGEFISAVFFYLYNQTIAKMADYHRKLVFTQNIGLALKISDGLTGNEKTEAQRALTRLRGFACLEGYFRADGER